MSEPLQKKKEYRKRHLFARSLDDVVKTATKPLMDKKGKLYSALIANWPSIVGEERAKCTRPGRLQFPTHEATGATLHLDVHPAKAPSMHYETTQLLEQCARYFGYRAIERIVFHAAHDMVQAEPKPPTTKAAPAPTPAENQAAPADLQEVLQRMRQRIMSEPPK